MVARKPTGCGHAIATLAVRLVVVAPLLGLHLMLAVGILHGWIPAVPTIAYWDAVWLMFFTTPIVAYPLNRFEFPKKATK